MLFPRRGSVYSPLALWTPCLLISSLFWTLGVFAVCVASEGLPGLLDSSWVQSTVGSGRRPDRARGGLGILFPQSRAPLALCLDGCVVPWKAPAPVSQGDSRSNTSCTFGALGVGGLLPLATGPSVSTHRCVLPWSPALQFVHQSTCYLIIYKLFAFTSAL